MILTLCGIRQTLTGCIKSFCYLIQWAKTKTLLSDGTLLMFEPVHDDLPIVLTDKEGNQWDVFCRAVCGPREGELLRKLTQMMGYWFSFAAFYPNISIYDF